jgi:hypothetical protein
MLNRRRNRRKRHFVDAEVQSGLLLQCAFHWGVFGLGTVIFLFLFHYIVTPVRHDFTWYAKAMWDRYGLIALVLLCLLPIFVLDLLKFSNRFVGPLVQLRKAVRQLALGQEVQPLKFRKGDYWLSLAEDFNAMLERTQSSRPLGDAFPSDEPANHFKTHQETYEQPPQPALTGVDC